MSIPTRRDKLLRDPLHGSTYIRLRDRHRPVTPDHGWQPKGPKREDCAACRTRWPCEVGQALAIIDALLLQLVTR